MPLKKITKIFLVSFVLLFVLELSPLLAVDLGGLKNSGEAMGYKNDIDPSNANIAYLVGIFTEVVISFIGVIFMILILMGALDITGANGNEEHLLKGKNRIKNGAIGILIVLVAYLITKTVLALASGEVF